VEIFVTNKWGSYLSEFSDEFRDIYFEEDYVKLYENDNEEAVCFIYKNESNIFLFPFLRRKFMYNHTVLYDFETAYGYGGPIIKKTDDNFFKEALDEFYSYCKLSNYVAGFVRFHPFLDNYKYYDIIGEIIHDRKTVSINLSLSENEIWMNEIHAKNRNTIKKGIKKELLFVVDEEYKYLDKFIELYSKTMQRLDADNFYFFKDDYYKRLKKQLKNSFLGLVFKDDKIISAAIFFYSKNYGHYHLSGSDVQYSSFGANNYMLYNAALELKHRGIKKFQLGGGTTSSDNDSLLKFKERFSHSQDEFVIGKTIFNQDVYKALCDEWILNNPQKTTDYKYHLLKYKY
jgi:hypothetical protein